MSLVEKAMLPVSREPAAQSASLAVEEAASIGHQIGSGNQAFKMTCKSPVFELEAASAAKIQVFLYRSGFLQRIRVVRVQQMTKQGTPTSVQMLHCVEGGYTEDIQAVDLRPR